MSKANAFFLFSGKLAGNERLAVYRDAARPTFVAREFQDMVDRLPSLADFVPNVRRYLLDFPNATLPGSDSFIYWQEAEFGLKPTIRISHVAIQESPEDSRAFIALSLQPPAAMVRRSFSTRSRSRKPVL